MCGNLRMGEGRRSWRHVCCETVGQVDAGVGCGRVMTDECVRGGLALG